MHRNKHKQKAPETKPASEAIQMLTMQYRAQLQQAVDALAALALRDAKLDPKDGWRFDVERCQYVKL